MKLLDTTFLIDLVKGDQTLGEMIDSLDQSGPHATTSINVHEFLVGGHGSSPTKELEIRKKVISRLVVLDYDNKSAEISSEIEAWQRDSGTFVGTPDIMIAAVMIQHGIKEIVTRNAKHFESIDQITVVNY